MLKAVLQYTDCLQDGRNVFTVLARNGVTILKTRDCGIHPLVTIVVKDYHHLNDVVAKCNATCSYEVRVVKTKFLKEN